MWQAKGKDENSQIYYIPGRRKAVNDINQVPAHTPPDAL